MYDVDSNILEGLTRARVSIFCGKEELMKDVTIKSIHSPEIFPPYRYRVFSFEAFSCDINFQLSNFSSYRNGFINSKTPHTIKIDGKDIPIYIDSYELKLPDMSDGRIRFGGGVEITGHFDSRSFKEEKKKFKKKDKKVENRFEILDL